jgi:hypothetical protein
VALGLLGRAGYANKKAADILLNHQSLGGLRKLYRDVCGRTMTESTLLSRMTHHEEIEVLRQEDPAAYRRGVSIAEQLTPLVRGTL